VFRSSRNVVSGSPILYRWVSLSAVVAPAALRADVDRAGRLVADGLAVPRSRASGGRWSSRPGGPTGLRAAAAALVMEHSFAWAGCRLTRNDERLADLSVGLHILALARPLLHRLVTLLATRPSQTQSL
jgi:hypothetical protein